MTYVPKRAWWKLWPVMCRRHWRVARRGRMCYGCWLEMQTKVTHEVYLEKILTIKDQVRV